MQEYCFICGCSLIPNRDYKRNNGEPLMICSDEKCDEENRMVI